MKDYYYILGLDKNAKLDDIRTAYRKLSKKFHPDLNDGDKYFENRFKEILEAYGVLSDPDKKIKYDEALRHYNSNTVKNRNSSPSYEKSNTATYVKKESNDNFSYYAENIKTNVNKNISETKTILSDAWENARSFSILFIICFLFWIIIGFEQDVSENKLTVLSFIIKPLTAIVLATLSAIFIGGAISAIISLFNRKQTSD
ncbi:MAG: J domain-containing protein [Syntrophothermus sp.]